MKQFVTDIAHLPHSFLKMTLVFEQKLLFTYSPVSAAIPV